MPFKDILSRGLEAPFVQLSKTINAILVVGIIRNNSVKLFCIWTSGLVGNAVNRYLLSRALVVFLFNQAESFVQFW